MLPPSTFKAMIQLLTTYDALMLEMLFGDCNLYLDGVNMCKHQLMAMRPKKHELPPSYYDNLN